MKPLDTDGSTIGYTGYTELYRKLKVLDRIKKGNELTHSWTQAGKPRQGFTEDEIDDLAWAQIPFVMSNYKLVDPIEAVRHIKRSHSYLKKRLLESEKVFLKTAE